MTSEEQAELLELIEKCETVREIDFFIRILKGKRDGLEDKKSG